jgi:hypothetical protein
MSPPQRLVVVAVCVVCVACGQSSSNSGAVDGGRVTDAAPDSAPGFADSADAGGPAGDGVGLSLPIWPEFVPAYNDMRAATMELVSESQSKWNGSYGHLLQGVEMDPGDSIGGVHSASSATAYEAQAVDPFLNGVFNSSNLGATFSKMLIHFPMAQQPDGSGRTFWEWEAQNDCSAFGQTAPCPKYFYQDPDGQPGHWCGVTNPAGGYYAPDTECGKFIAVWQYIIQQVHDRYHAHIIVQSQVQPATQIGASSSPVYNLSGFYGSINGDYAAFNAGRAAQCALIGNWPGSAAPESIDVLSEPDTMYAKGAPPETDPSASNGSFVSNIQSQLVTILNTMNEQGVPASVVRVIGMGNWESQLTQPCQGQAENGTTPCGILGVETGINSLVTGYPSNPGVSVEDIHMHYNSDCSRSGSPCGGNTTNYMTRAVTIADAITAAGFGIGFDESWPYEDSNTQLGAGFDLNVIEANDADLHWQPFNQLWMLMLDLMSYRYGATYISFSNPPMYFYNADVDMMSAALKCDPLQANGGLAACTVAAINAYVQRGVTSALSTSASGPIALTSTGQYLKGLISQPSTYVRIDTTPPTVPQKLAGTKTSQNVSLSWRPATDDIAVADYAVYRDSALIGHAVGTAYVDASSGRGGTYTIVAEDANGNQSGPSNAVVL